MKFYLFSEISFEISDPIALIESYCFQSDFYTNYDCLINKKVDDVNKIGARIRRESLLKCKDVIEKTKDLSIFNYDLDKFLELHNKTKGKHINNLNENVTKELFKIKGIKLSTATKILHTLYPKIIPIIDNQLQAEYQKEINSHWNEEQSDQILTDYYNNLKKDDNWNQLTQIFNILLKNNILHLTKVRIFDILWWSYLKAKKLKKEKMINWSIIK